MRHVLQATKGGLSRGLLGLITIIFGLGIGMQTAQALSSGPVQTKPASFTPQLASSNSTVRQLVPCGSQMYAVGSFSSIKQSNGAVFARNNAFSFNATTGVISSWNPNVNGTVNSVGLSANCGAIYLGGLFGSVGGMTVKNLAEVNATTGALVPAFAHSANGQVETLLVQGTHVLTGGYFTGANGSTKKYMVSLNSSTGMDDGYVNLNISGHYVYTDAGGKSVSGNGSRVANYSLSPNGSKLLAMGDFTSVGGTQRQQIFMLDLGSTAATLDPWYSPEFNANCATVEPFYVRAATWSPDGSKVYTATTGYKPATGSGFSTHNPRTGLCDSVAAFPSSASSSLSHLWVNYTGCDSLYAVASDMNDVYIGGHQRWANNPNGCDAAGPGALSRPGVGDVSPTSGLATAWDPTRGRGHGADDMLITSSGLWIASDNFLGATRCGGVTHEGICLLPY